MTPRGKKRPSLFPAYAPPDTPDLTLEEWARHFGAYVQTIAMRLAQVATLIATIIGGTAYAANVGDKPASVTLNAATVVRIKALEDSMISNSRRIDDNESLARSILYISCETLKRVQPAAALPPQECR